MAAPTFISLDADPLAAGQNRTQVNFDWDHVAGEADNDVVIYVIYKESTAAYTATPAGWNQLTGFPTDQSTGGFRYRMDIWWRRRSGDTNPAPTWTWSGTTWAYAKGWLGRGLVTAETPIVTISTDKEAAQNTQPSNPGLTVARTDSGLLFIIWNFAGATSTTDPTGFTERPASTQNPAELFVYEDLSTTTGASGAVASVLDDPEYASSVLLEIATSAGGGVSGTGDITIAAPALAATGALTFAATGTVSIGAPSMAASGTVATPVTGTGDVTISAPALEAAGDIPVQIFAIGQRVGGIRVV